MGVEKAVTYGIMGFIADRVLGTGALGTIAASLWGGLMSPDAGEMSTAYDKRRATLRDTVQNFGGFDISGISLFGDTKNDVRPSRERAEEEATRREKKDGIGWGKLLLGGAAAFLGINLLDNIMSGPFSNGLYAPFANWGGGGMNFGGLNMMPGAMNFMPGGGFIGGGGWGGGGILSNLAMNVLGLSPWGILC
jgi:hypothetical protein